MIACRPYQDSMVESLYGEMDDARRAEFDAHLASCPDCARLHDEMRATLALMSARRRPEPGPEYWDTYCERLEQRLAREGSSAWDGRRFVGSWGFRVAAAVLILAAGVWLGRGVFAPTPHTPATTAPELADGAKRAPGSLPDTAEAGAARPAPRAPGGAIDAPAGEARRAPVELASVEDPTRRYLDRSQVVLLAILNADASDEGYAAEMAAGRERAGALVVEGRAVRAALPREDRRLRELVDQLELILREIAHLEENANLESVDVIRGRLEREGVLLRINLEQMRESGATASAPRSDAIDSNEEGTE